MTSSLEMFTLSITIMDMEVAGETKRKKSTSKEHHQHGNNLESLPQEIALDIISRLQIKSIIQFRYVCRSWHKLSHNHDLVNLHLTRTLKNNNISIIFHCDFPVNNQLYFVEFSDQDRDKDVVRKIRIPFSTILPEFQVVSSCNGLLCLSNSLFHDGPCVYNPFTRDYKMLPKSTEFQDQEVVLGFGVHPNTNEYRVIRIVYYWNLYELCPRISRRFRNRNFPRSEVQIFCQGSEKWRVLSGEIPYKLQQSSGGVLVNGRLHWVSISRKNQFRRNRIVVSFDLSDEVFREVPLPEFDVYLMRHRYSLSVLAGCLSIVDPSTINYTGHDIWVMKEYGVKESWEKVFSIGAYDMKLSTSEMRQSYRMWKNVLCQQFLRVLCLLKNGEILLQYRWGALVSYNRQNGMFNDLKFQGMPDFFHTTVHFGSLSQANAPPNFQWCQLNLKI